MNDLTSLITEEIKKQYKSVRRFAMELGIPQTTLVSALKNGIGGTSFDTVMKMLNALNIKIGELEAPISLDSEMVELIKKFGELDPLGTHTVKVVIDVEHKRCKGL